MVALEGVARDTAMDVDTPDAPEDDGKVNLANAVHLSDSEEEEEMEDIIHDFAAQMDFDAVCGIVSCHFLRH